ncbi:MAG: RHS repeat-associated core domain-containing protein [Armatimonadetes bacterium]|nr:RHS repeat-associated core domain-containing protein [Armatimonadota bacterium]
MHQLIRRHRAFRHIAWILSLTLVTLAVTPATGERATMTLPGETLPWTYQYQDPETTARICLPKDDPNSVCPLLSRITDEQSRQVDYSIDPSGFTYRVVGNKSQDMMGQPCYQKAEYTADRNGSGYTHGRLVTVLNTYKSGLLDPVVLTRNDYTYTLLGLRATNAILVNTPTPVSRTETYGYDLQNRLVSANYGDAHWQNYAFDAMGNRTSLQHDGLTRELSSYNEANMLLTRGANTYTNDDNGNQLTGGGRANTWDSQNRLRQCVTAQHTSAFTYAADGLRRQTVLDGQATTRYTLDSSMVIRENTAGGVNAGQVTYLCGPRGPEYRRTGLGQNAQVTWYCYDGLGSVLAEVSSTGYITGARQMDVYGAPRATQGAPTSKQAFVGALGHPTEDDTGLIYMRARWMDPVTGTFVSEDPAQDGANWFGYCPTNPITCYDPSGCGETLGSISVGTGGSLTIGTGGTVSVEAAVVSVTSDTLAIEVCLVQSANTGFIPLRTMLAALRAWATGQGISSIYMQAVAGSENGQKLMETAVRVINAMGDKGGLQANDPFTLLYWLIQ